MNPRTPRRKLQTESNRSFHLSQNCFSHKIKVFVGFLSHGLKKTYFHNISKSQNGGSLNGKFATFLPFMSLLNGQVASTRWSWSNGTATSLLGVIGPEFGDGNFGRETTKKGMVCKANIRVSYFFMHNFSKMFWKGVSQLNCQQKCHDTPNTTPKCNLDVVIRSYVSS